MRIASIGVVLFMIGLYFLASQRIAHINHETHDKNKIFEHYIAQTEVDKLREEIKTKEYESNTSKNLFFGFGFGFVGFCFIFIGIRQALVNRMKNMQEKKHPPHDPDYLPCPACKKKLLRGLSKCHHCGNKIPRSRVHA